MLPRFWALDLGVTCLHWYLLVIAATLGATPAAKPAASEPSPTSEAQRARAVFVLAQNLYKQGKFADALARFEEAYRLKPHPSIFYNLGRCSEQLHDVPRALRAYRLYLHELPDAVDREAVGAVIIGLERKLKDRGVQQLMVFAEPADAVVSVDGTALGPPPATVELPSGDHRLLIARPGLVTVDRSFVMSTSKSMTLSFELSAEPELPAPPPTPPLVVSEAKSEPAPPVATAVSQSPPSTYPLRSKVWAPLIAVAVGGATAAVGFSQTASASSSLDQELQTQMQVTPRAEELASQGKTMQALGWVGVAVAGAGVATAAVFWFLPGHSEVAPVVGLWPGGGAIGVRASLP